MFRAIISPILRSTRTVFTACGIKHRRWCLVVTDACWWPAGRRNFRPKHDELIEITNKLLLLHLVGCLYYCIIWNVFYCTVSLFCLRTPAVLYITQEWTSFITANVSTTLITKESFHPKIIVVYIAFLHLICILRLLIIIIITLIYNKH